MKRILILIGTLAASALLGQQVVFTTNETVAVRPLYSASSGQPIGVRYFHSGMVYSNRVDGTNLTVLGRVNTFYYEVDETNRVVN